MEGASHPGSLRQCHFKLGPGVEYKKRVLNLLTLLIAHVFKENFLLRLP